jgi:hypothetical protein
MLTSNKPSTIVRFQHLTNLPSLTTPTHPLLHLLNTEFRPSSPLTSLYQTMADPGTADVQAELQDYLNSKNINTLFIQIVESLLIEKPDNPIGFIVEYLQKKYPDQAGSVQSSAAEVTEAAEQ